MTRYNQVESFNKQLSLNSFDLVSRKIDLSLYFFQLSRLENNEECEKFAEKYLNETLSTVDTVKEVNIKNGLSGIGLGINHLVKNGFVNGNINTILEDIDNYLFKTSAVALIFNTLQHSNNNSNCSLTF
jgi:hypothetical protein